MGRDTHAATDESIEATTNTTVALVILILLIIYRSVLLAIVPLVTIALLGLCLAPADRALGADFRASDSR